MIWQNPWAWIGLAALGVPIAVHLLARRQATRLPFPSLRFLDASSRVSIRRHRLTDHALLAARLAILLAAVAALAQPFLLTTGRRLDPGARLVRAIVVDTSASMQRTTPAGTTAIADARLRAQSATEGAAASRLIEGVDLRSAIAGAVAWLGTEPGRREVLVISDFQRGAIDADDLATVPPGIGVRLLQVAAQSGTTIAMPAVSGLTSETRSTARPTETATDAEWTTASRAGLPPSSLLLAGANEQAGADAARDAAFVGGLPAASRDRPTAIVFPGANERASLLARVTPVDQPWMYDAIVRLTNDPTIAAAARTVRTTSTAPALPLDRGTVIARDADGRPIAIASAGDVDTAHRLIVFSTADAGSVLSASLIAGLARATSASTPVSELEPASLPAQDLARWERPPTEVAPPSGQPGDASDGRWLWAVALALLAGESWLRRRPRQAKPVPLVHERVA